ncbi:MAG: hypothetical protein ABIL62_01315 [Planctomycetota bacterium]
MPACSKHPVPIRFVGQWVLSDQVSLEEPVNEHRRLVINRAIETRQALVGMDFQIEDLSLVLSCYLEDFDFCDFQVRSLALAQRPEWLHSRHDFSTTQYPLRESTQAGDYTQGCKAR